MWDSYDAFRSDQLITKKHAGRAPQVKPGIMQALKKRSAPQVHIIAGALCQQWPLQYALSVGCPSRFPYCLLLRGKYWSMAAPGGIR